MKTCCMCSLEKINSEFKSSKRNRDGLQSQCIGCQKEYRRKHYLANRAKYINKAVTWRKKFYIWWKEYKKQFKCECGETHPGCIEFHHHSDDKEACVSQLVMWGCKQRVLKEIAKCTPMCSNCHGKLHWNERNKD